jgi:hypothetical protein
LELAETLQEVILVAKCLRKASSLQGAMKPKELMKEKKRCKVKRGSDEAHWKFSKKADMECK